MKLKKQATVFIALILSAALFIACSSSSGTLRYNSKSDKNNSEDKTSSRYSPDDQNTQDDTISFSNEDIPEIQDPSDLPEDETPLNIKEIIKKIENKSTGSDLESSVSTKRELLLMEIIKYLNTPYKYGGNSINGIDCSAFTQNVFHGVDLFELNRSARDQFQQGIEINDRSDLKFGDLVFFNTRRRVRPGHVGIYVGDNLFAHASSKLGVTISSLDLDYYSKRFMGARRIDTNHILN